MFARYVLLTTQVLTATVFAKSFKVLETRQSVTCNQAYISEDTDTCESVLERFGITQAEFYAWNSFIEADCSAFIPGFAYCVRGVVAGPSSSSTSQGVVSTATTLKTSTTAQVSSTTRLLTTTRVTTSSAASPSSNISVNGECAKNGKTCLGSTFGDCCSGSGWCGKTDDFCKAGCQTGFGTCTGANISVDGQCGGVNGKTCLGSTFGNCCSSSGWCGSTTEFCATGCQSSFGTCSAIPSLSSIKASTTSSAKPSPSSSISTDGRCGAFNGKTCAGSTFGGCCSSASWCGGEFEHCNGDGCQLAFGTCAVKFTTTSIRPSPTPTSNISQDGSCGGTEKKTCKGSVFGDCCSVNGYCGSTNDFCQVGCQSAFGSCKEHNISIDGQCGANGKTCTGSTFGNCCSKNNWCGTTDGHCDAISGCQSKFGTCSTSNISTDGSCGANGKTCVGSSFGNCCSKTGWCGTGVDFCAQGCQKTSSSACITNNIPSLTGECGPKNGGFVCAGGPFNGGCCSSSGWCGKGAGFCS